MIIVLSLLGKYSIGVSGNLYEGASTILFRLMSQEIRMLRYSEAALCKVHIGSKSAEYGT